MAMNQTDAEQSEWPQRRMNAGVLGLRPGDMDSDFDLVEACWAASVKVNFAGEARCQAGAKSKIPTAFH